MGSAKPVAYDNPLKYVAAYNELMRSGFYTPMEMMEEESVLASEIGEGVDDRRIAMHMRDEGEEMVSEGVMSPRMGYEGSMRKRVVSGASGAMGRYDGVRPNGG